VMSTPAWRAASIAAPGTFSLARNFVMAHTGKG
jgi:hypothetical protein